MEAMSESQSHSAPRVEEYDDQHQKVSDDLVPEVTEFNKQEE